MGYYRYGFNGKEKDVDGEWGENTTNYDYGFRIYNPSLGKFLSVDPLSPDYPELTPYQFASNSPIQAIDLDGLEVEYTQSWNVSIDSKGNYVSKKLTEPVLTYEGPYVGPTMIHKQFFYEDEFYGDSKSNIPGYEEWHTAKTENFKNKRDRSFKVIGGGLSVVGGLLTMGVSLELEAAGMTAFTFMSGMYSTSAGVVDIAAGAFDRLDVNVPGNLSGATVGVTVTGLFGDNQYTQTLNLVVSLTEAGATFNLAKEGTVLNKAEEVDNFLNILNNSRASVISISEISTSQTNNCNDECEE